MGGCATKENKENKPADGCVCPSRRSSRLVLNACTSIYMISAF